MQRVDTEELRRWRGLDATTVLSLLASHAKPDPTFVPIKDKRTARWHANVQGKDFEFLVTGPKFFDTRASRGGGGAIDLAMHLFGINFKAASELLRKTRL